MNDPIQNALRRTGAFPAPDPARDARVKDAVRAALTGRPKRRMGPWRFRLTAAAGLLLAIGLIALFASGGIKNRGRIASRIIVGEDRPHGEPPVEGGSPESAWNPVAALIEKGEALPGGAGTLWDPGPGTTEPYSADGTGYITLGNRPLAGRTGQIPRSWMRSDSEPDAVPDATPARFRDGGRYQFFGIAIEPYPF